MKWDRNTVGRLEKLGVSIEEGCEDSLHTKPLQKTADLATDFSGGFYPLQFNDGLATATNLATDLPTDNIPSPK